MADRLTALFMPESAYGPTNNCIGIADVLRRRGHRIVFAAEASWKGRLAALGFEEDLVDLAPPPENAQGEQDAGAFWKEFIAQTAPQFRLPTVDQLATVTRPIWEGLTEGARYCQPQLREIVARSGADVLVQDNVQGFPALVTAGRPFVRLVSCNPLELTGPGVPPTFSGYPTADPRGWAEFRAEYDRTHRPLWSDYDAWVRDQGAPPLPDLEFTHSGETNLYVYPAELDYLDARPLGPRWHRVESCVRTTDPPADLPPGFTSAPDSRLVYLSLGSLGSADVGLMRRLIGILAGTPHRYLVSTGPLHAEIELAPNMHGAEFLPQTSLLPLVDAVITHGGNNTTTEAMHFGLPMVVLPLFWDQYDNAQRVHETGYGLRLDTYGCSASQLTGALQRVLDDDALRARCAAAGRRIRAADGLTRAAEQIERAAGR